MAKAAKKADPAKPVVVLGDHPAAHVAAITLAAANVPTTLVDPGHDRGDVLDDRRLVAVNPDLATLLPKATAMPKLAGASEVGVVRFLGGKGEVAETTDGFATAGPPGVVPMGTLRGALAGLAEAQRVDRRSGATRLLELDDARGVALDVAGERLDARLAIACDGLSPDLAAGLRIADDRATHDRLTLDLGVAGEPEVAFAALDLDEAGSWGLSLAADGRRQAVVFSRRDAGPALEAWLGRLRAAGVNGDTRAEPTRSRVELATALQRDVVGRLTLLAGPVGGFLGSTGDEVYPCCWSACYAGQAAAKATKATHVQDALSAYRGAWGGTLGEYLQGPQQNMQFLLPLVYKNPVMTDRVAEALFRGKSLVR